MSELIMEQIEDKSEYNKKALSDILGMLKDSLLLNSMIKRVTDNVPEVIMDNNTSEMEPDHVPLYNGYECSEFDSPKECAKNFSFLKVSKVTLPLQASKCYLGQDDHLFRSVVIQGDFHQGDDDFCQVDDLSQESPRILYESSQILHESSRILHGLSTSFSHRDDSKDNLQPIPTQQALRRPFQVDPPMDPAFDATTALTADTATDPCGNSKQGPRDVTFRKKHLQGTLSVIFSTLVLQLIVGSFPAATASEIQVQHRVVAGLGGDALFTCISPSILLTNVVWLINGTSLASLQLSNVDQEFGSISRVGSLRFSNVPVEYNNTVVQCIANTSSQGEVSPGNSTLLVQGLLSAVQLLTISSAEDSTVILTWIAPFTLDIALVNPDIMYCVDVVNSASSATLHSECGITATEFTYPLPPDRGCNVYTFTVTPVNVVGNGTRRSIDSSQALLSPELKNITRLSPTTYSLLMTAPVCTANLTFMNTDAEDVENDFDSKMIILENNITFTARENRHYDVTITASNIANSFTSNTTISTHDLMDFSVNTTTSPEDTSTDIIQVITTFVENSNAGGVMLSFIYIGNETDVTVNFTLSYCQTLNTLPDSFNLPLSPGPYMVYAYDIESNMLLLDGTGYPASSNPYMATGNYGDFIPVNQSCNITGSITVLCHFHDISITGFQITAQSRNSVNVLHVSTTLDLKFPAVVEVQKLGQYQVTILPILTGTGILYGREFSRIHTVNHIPTTQDTSSVMPSSTVPSTVPSRRSVAAVGKSTIGCTHS